LQEDQAISAAVSIPQTVVSWTNSPTVHPRSLPGLHQAPQAPAATGLLLSPASEPFPQKLVDKVRSGQFVDMKELLVDNRALVHELEAIQGNAVQWLGARRPHLREVSSLPTLVLTGFGRSA
jgi:hypothetical protein